MRRLYQFLAGILAIIFFLWGISAYMQSRTGNVSDKLVIYNWGDYIDPDLLTKFTKETKLYNSDVLSLTGSASSTSVSSIQANDDIQVYVEKNRMKINGKFTSATVYDLTGKIIKNISNDGTEIILNTGIYIVAIDNTVTRKIIIL